MERKKPPSSLPKGSLQAHVSPRMCISAIRAGLTLWLSMLESGLVWMDKVLWRKKKKKLLFHYCVCGLWPGSHRQCEHSLFVSLLSSPSCGVTQWLHSPLSGKIQSTILQSSLRLPSLQQHAFGHCVAQISRVTIELLAFKLENIHWLVEKVSSPDNPMQRERPGPAGEMCPSFIQPYSLTNSMFVHNTSPQ